MSVLVWAVSAKNALQNHGGYYPNQLFFGNNVNLLLSVIIDFVPALESVTCSDIVMKFDCFTWRKEEFDKNRIKWEHYASFMTQFENLLWRKLSKWRQSVWSKESTGKLEWFCYSIRKGNFVLIQHGSAFYRCHSRHIMKATQQKSPTTTGWNQSIKTIDVFQIKFTKKEYSSSDDTEDDIDKEEDNTSNSE